MEHQMRPLSKENTIERKHKSAWFSSFSLPNPWLNWPKLCKFFFSIIILITHTYKKIYYNHQVQFDISSAWKKKSEIESKNDNKNEKDIIYTQIG